MAASDWRETVSLGRASISLAGHPPPITNQLGRFYVLVPSGLGFTLGPVLGRLMAELVAEGCTSLPTAAFGLEHAWADS